MDHYTAWMDRKPVHVMSTFSASKDIVHRAAKGPNGRYQRIEVSRPLIIGNYNYGMGGTDRFDQQLSYYRISLRTRHWKRKIYAHMINVAVVNSHIIFVESRKQRKRESDSRAYPSLLQFQEMLITELGFPQTIELPREVYNEPPPRRRTLPKALADVRRRSGIHEPLILKRSRDGPNTRKTCLWCQKSGIYTMCKTCNTPLCMSTCYDDPNDDSCFLQFHTAPIPI